MKDVVIHLSDRLIKDTNPSHFDYHEKFMSYMKNDKINSFGKWMFNNGYNAGVVTLQSELQKKELARYKWVSVDDKLPEVDKEVLCRNECGDMTLGHIDGCKFALELTDKMWETDVEGFNVRYWMFLPFEDVQEGE